MQEPFLNVSRRRRIARRVGAAGIALATVLVLGACKADGGGYIGAPLDGGVVGVYEGDANFGFNFTCHMETAKRKAVIRGQITYHDDPSAIDVPVDPEFPNGSVEETDFPEIRLHGIVEPIVIFNVFNCEEAVAELFEGEGPPEFEGVPAALFEGTYRPQGPTPDIPGNERHGEFTVLVGDQGEPARPGGEFTGDLFSVELFFGPYNGYTRGGYIEGGNLQVE